MAVANLTYRSVPYHNHVASTLQGTSVGDGDCLLLNSNAVNRVCGDDRIDDWMATTESLVPIDQVCPRCSDLLTIVQRGYFEQHLINFINRMVPPRDMKT